MAATKEMTYTRRARKSDKRVRQSKPTSVLEHLSKLVDWGYRYLIVNEFPTSADVLPFLEKYSGDAPVDVSVSDQELDRIHTIMDRLQDILSEDDALQQQVVGAKEKLAMTMADDSLADWVKKLAIESDRYCVQENEAALKNPDIICLARRVYANISGLSF